MSSAHMCATTPLPLPPWARRASWSERSNQGILGGEDEQAHGAEKPERASRPRGQGSAAGPHQRADDRGRQDQGNPREDEGVRGGGATAPGMAGWHLQAERVGPTSKQTVESRCTASPSHKDTNKPSHIGARPTIIMTNPSRPWLERRTHSAVFLISTCDGDATSSG